jgi:type I restriction enzyme, S subunit
MIRKHETYKDSGVEWIGEIPKGWEVEKLKYAAKILSGFSPEQCKPSQVDDGTPYIKVDNLNIEHAEIDAPNGFVSCDFVVSKMPSILFPKRGAAIALNKVSLITIPFSMDTNIMGLELTNNKLTIKYLYYILKCVSLISIADTSTIPQINNKHIEPMIVPLPDYEEQSAIASFLDRKTAEIDLLITRKEKLIAHYEEEKTAIINHAVTKGLDPKVKTKPSGIEWLGDIPEHWEVKRLKYVASMKSGEGITSDQIKESGDYPVYGGNGLRGYFDSFTHEGEHALIGRQGALCGNINYTVGKFWASEHAIVCTLRKLYVTKWFGELLRIMNLNQYSVSAAQPGLSIDNIKILQIPVPPIPEQTTIVAHIETECSRLNTIIEKFKKQINLFKEYRTTLISEVVTGKIDVRDEVAA